MILLSSMCRYLCSAAGPFPQARDAAQWEEEEERANPNLKKVTIKRRKKRFRSSTKMNFMSLRFDVKVIFNLQARIMCIALDSTQSHTYKRTFGVDTHCQLGKIPYPVPGSTYRIGVGLEVSLIPIRVISYRCTDSSGGIIKIPYQADGGDISLNWVLVMWHMWLVWILTTNHKSLKRVKNFERLVIFSCYCLLILLIK